jgi:hypothetical protein
MQFEITDEAAIAFSEVFYEAVADSYPIDTAVAQGRKGILNATSGAEWGTPVIYMRSQDGRLFDVTRNVEPAPSPPIVQERPAEEPIVPHAAPPPPPTPKGRDAPAVTVDAAGETAQAPVIDEATATSRSPEARSDETKAEQVPTPPVVTVPYRPAPQPEPAPEGEPGDLPPQPMFDGGAGNRVGVIMVLSLVGAVAAIALLAIGALVVAGVIKVPAFSGGSTARSTAVPTVRASPTAVPFSPTTVVKTLTIPATDQWTDTGIDLKRGAQVTITATGQVRHSQSQPPVGPDGDNRPELQQFSILPNVPHAALIGMVDNPGQVFPVGHSFNGNIDATPLQQGTAGAVPRRAEGNRGLGGAQSSVPSSLDPPATGRLFLGVNDKGVDNNSGYFTAQIKVVQP